MIVLSMGWPINTNGGAAFYRRARQTPRSMITLRRHTTGGSSRVMADRTFRPGNAVTRGQISKIIVRAAGWPINTSGGPHFTDVPPTNPFYGDIETAFHRGIITGYSNNTFGWGNDATRAQLSKMLYLTLAAVAPTALTADPNCYPYCGPATPTQHVDPHGNPHIYGHCNAYCYDDPRSPRQGPMPESDPMLA